MKAPLTTGTRAAQAGERHQKIQALEVGVIVE